MNKNKKQHKTSQQKKQVLTALLAAILITSSLGTILFATLPIGAQETTIPCLQTIKNPESDENIVENELLDNSGDNLSEIINGYNGPTDLSDINLNDPSGIEYWTFTDCMNNVTIQFEYVGSEAGYDNILGYYHYPPANPPTLNLINQINNSETAEGYLSETITLTDDHDGFGLGINVSENAQYFTDSSYNDPEGQNYPQPDHALIYEFERQIVPGEGGANANGNPNENGNSNGNNGNAHGHGNGNANGFDTITSYLICLEDYNRSKTWGKDFDDLIVIMHILNCTCEEDEETPEDSCGATEIIEYVNGSGINPDADRDNPNRALGLPNCSDKESENNPPNFVSLGKGGYIILKFGQPIGNIPNNEPDFRLVETSYGDPDCAIYEEKAEVFVKQYDEDEWSSLGEICLDRHGEGYFYLEDAGLEWVQYVKVQDNTTREGDGYDLDGIGVFNCLSEIPEKTITINATKIVCPCENCLPNWGDKHDYPSTITPDAINTFLQDNPCCTIDPDWKFEYEIGEHGDPTNYNGNQLEQGAEGWTKFTGETTITIPQSTTKLMVREILQPGYIKFIGNTGNDETPDDDVSAELYAHKDNWKYDNYDRIVLEDDIDTYYIVGFNAPICDESINLIKNGDFETPEVNGGWQYFDNASFENWTILWRDTTNPGNLELQKSVKSWNQLPGSNQYAELDTHGRPDSSETSVTIFQDIQTCPGRHYNLSFAFSPRPEQGLSENILNVTILNESYDIIATNEYTADGSSLDDTDWTMYTIEFVADSCLTRIQFTDRGSPNQLGTFLDNVSLHAICDPENGDDDEPTDDLCCVQENTKDDSTSEEQYIDNLLDDDYIFDNSNDPDLAAFLNNQNFITDQTQIQEWILCHDYDYLQLDYEYLGKEATYTNVFGYWLNQTSPFHPLFKNGTLTNTPSDFSPGETGSRQIPITNDLFNISFGIHAINTDKYYSSVNNTNPDEKDHVLVYKLSETAQSKKYLLCHEDLIINTLKDTIDFSDLIVILNISCTNTPDYNIIDNDSDGYTENDGDCNDSNASIHPGAEEVCDDIDNNCNDLIDENNCCNPNLNEEKISPILECVEQIGETTYKAYFGYLNENDEDITIDIGPENKFTPSPQDRDQPTIFQPGRNYSAFNVTFNGNNLVWTLTGPDGNTRTATASANSPPCSSDPPSFDDTDQDGDGYDSIEDGGDDCDDSNASIHPGAEEICDDDVDNDCDGLIDENDPDCDGSNDEEDGDNTETEEDKPVTKKKTTSSTTSSSSNGIKNTKPVAIISEPYEYTVNDVPITLDGSQSYDPDEDDTITKYKWKLGDGTVLYGESIEYDLQKTAGEYYVTLKVYDMHNEHSLEDTKIIIVQPNRPPEKPSIGGIFEIPGGETYSFSAQSNDPDGDDLQYTFSWGDDNSDTSDFISLPKGSAYSMLHSWNEPGEHTLTVTVSDGELTSSAEVQVQITPAPIDPLVIYSLLAAVFAGSFLIILFLLRRRSIKPMNQ